MQRICLGGVQVAIFIFVTKNIRVERYTWVLQRMARADKYSPDQHISVTESGPIYNQSEN